nr:hypothetical protein [Tanacetum cinerariifolium]
MTWNKAHIVNYQEFKGGFVAFGGSNGRITGKGTIKAGRLNFEDVYYVEELKHYNLYHKCMIRRTRVLVTKPQNKTPYELLTGRQPIISYLRSFGCHVTILNTIDQLGKFDGKSDSEFLVGYSLNSKAFRVYNLETKRVEENLHEIDLYDEYFVLPIWTAYSTIVKSSKDKLQKTTDCKTCEKPVSQAEQIFQEELEKLKRQENEAYGAARKEATQKTQNANTNSTNLLNVVSTLVSAASLLGEFNDGEPSYLDDHSMPHLEDIYASPSEGIFTNSSYDDEGVVTDFNNLETTVNVSPTPITRIHTIHPKTQILRDPMSAVQTRSKVHKNSEAYALVSYIHKQQRNDHKDFQYCLFACFLSQIKPKKISQALEDESWVDAMQEELLQFQIQKVWILVDLPFRKKAIRTKWVYRNKKDERGVVVRNRARLVTQGHRQEEWIDYDEVFAPVARIEAIRISLVFASFMGFVVYQMDVKSAFMYGTLDEEVYVTQPPEFIDLKFPHKVYKVVKALYGLHQAPRAWDIMLIQVYVDDIIFGSTKKYWCDDFKELMKNRFQMSSMGELTFFLRLQDKQKKDGIFISHDKSMIGSLMYLTASRPDIMFAVCVCSRFQVTPKTSHLQDVKRIFRYLKGQLKLGLWYPKASLFDLEAYSDSDYAGANLDRKSTTGEAKYVVVAHCCGQVLWIHNQLLDYGFNLMNTKIYIDNEITIYIVKNPVFHYKTKHIETWHHFIRDAYEKKLIQVIKIHIDDNVVDLLTKAFDVSRRKLQEVRLDLKSSYWDRETFSEQTALGKDSLNPFMADNLQKLYGFQLIMLHSKELASPRQTALAKPTEREGFEEIIDFLNGSSVRYALTASLTIHTSCIKQFWSTTKIKTVNDEASVQALIDGKRVTIKEYFIRRILNTMASAIICLATNQKFNFSRYILLSLVKNIEAGVPFFMFHRFVKLIIDHQLGDISHHQDIYDNPPLSKKVFANMKKVGTGFSRVITPLFENVLVQAAEEVGQAKDDVSIPTEPSTSKPYKKHKSKKQQPIAPKVPSPAPSPEHQLPLPSNDPIPDADKDTDEGEPAEVEELLEVVKADKLMTEVVTTVAPTTTTAQVPKDSAPRKRRGVVIQDTEETTTSSVIVHTEDIAKKQRMDEEKEELKSHLHIVANDDDDDDVFTEATPLASKVPIVDYQIHHENNKPYYKIIRADGTHKLFLSFITLLKNFDREDLETLWKLVKERFESTKPKNFLDDFLLNILKIMFEKPNVEANMFLLVEKKYPLTHFTLQKMLDNVRLEVEEESEMSLELLRLVRR